MPQGGGDGMLATMGGRWGGWGLYLLKGKPVFNYNMLILAQYRWEGPDALTPGKHTIVFDYTYDGPGIAKGGSGVLKVDGKVVATRQAGQLDRVPAGGRRDLRRRRRHAHGRERQGLPGAVRLQRQDRQADRQPRAVAAERGGPEEGGRRCRQGERLGAKTIGRMAVSPRRQPAKLHPPDGMPFTEKTEKIHGGCLVALCGRRHRGSHRTRPLPLPSCGDQAAAGRGS